jgi:signal transduction histidine kinase
LQEVILNLIHNAIDAMESMHVDRRSLTVRTKPDGGNALVLEVQDSGPGIEKRQLAAIFEPFVTTKPKGTGLGLPICSRIIERHGGQLKASPDCSHGALFQIFLPIDAQLDRAAS